jgi:hypothetical protein
MTESEPTHRVVNKAHRRSSNDGGPALVYEAGDTITPTERELERFPSRFEPLADDTATTDDSTDESATSADETEADADTSDDADEDADATDGDETDETDATGPPPEPLTTEWVEAADYNGLRSAASRFEDVNGNWGADRLKAELLDRAE